MGPVLRLEFTQDVDTPFSIRAKIATNNALSGYLYMHFVYEPRNQAEQIPVYNPATGGTNPYSSLPGEYTANQFVTYLSQDTNFIVSSYEQVGNVVLITLIGGREFFDVEQLSGPNYSNYINEDYQDYSDIALEYFEILPASSESNNCDFFKLKVKATAYISAMMDRGSEIRQSNNSEFFPEFSLFEKDETRGNVQEYKIVGNTGTEVNVFPEQYLIVPKLLSSDFQFNEASNGTTSSITIIHDISSESIIFPLELEYSLNGTEWFSENVITGQTNGLKTIYIRDQLGCIVETEFEVLNNEIDESEPFHFISEANSIDFSLVENIDNCSVFKNYNNTSALHSLNKKNYSENILFNLCDNITTQFKTNYKDKTVTLIKEESNGTINEIDVPILQRTNNFNFFESYDCEVYKYSDNLYGIYFTEGNQYNENGEVIDTFESMNDLPRFATSSDILEIQGTGAFFIRDIIYDENIGKKVILIQNNFVSSQFQAIVSSTYNILEYDVFEFGFIFSNLGEGLYRVKIELEDERFDNVTYISENIEVLENHENTICIDYFSNNNRDVFYHFGIRNRIRVEYLDVEYDVKDEVENNIGDSNSELIKSMVNKKDRYFFDALTEKRRMTLILALSSEYCFINGIPYTKDEGVSLEHIKNTNLAYVEQAMIVANNSYKILGEDNINNIVPAPGSGLDDVIEPSPFITSGENFLRI